jgi:copper(I)-binding protein
MRLPVPALVAGLLVAALGVAGLIRAAVPQSSASTGTAAAPIVVTNAYVRPPPTPAEHTATAYFTIYNTTGTADTLQSVVTGAGASAVLQVISGGQLRVVPGLVVPAHGSVSLGAGTGRAVISGLFGTLKAGQSVNLELTFAHAGPIEVTATVTAVTAPAPGSSSTGAAK